MKMQKKLRQRWRQPNPSLCWIRKSHQRRKNSTVWEGVVVNRGVPGSPLLYIMLIAAQTHSDDFCRKRSQKIFKS